jgi:hypothetical protein
MVGLNYLGRLAEVDVQLSVFCDLDDEVLDVSIDQSFLWQPKPESERAQLDRLMSFASLGHRLAELTSPVFAALSPEELHSDDVAVKNSEEHARPHYPEFNPFTVTEVESLFKYLQKIYS